MSKCSETVTRHRSLRLHLWVFLLTLAFASAVLAQGDPDIVWQASGGGLALAFSTDGKMLLAGTRLFSAADGTVIRDFVLPYNGGGVTTVAFSPDGQYAAMGIQGFNQNLDLFRVADGVLIKGRITAHNNGTTSVAFSPDGQLLASGGRDGTAKLWHLPDMTLLRTLNGGVGYRARVFAVAFTRDGGTLAVGGQDGAQLFRVSDGERVGVLQGATSILSLAISPDNELIAAGSNLSDQQGQCVDCSIKTWRIADGTLLQTIDNDNSGVISIAFSPDQQVIASGSGDRVFEGVVKFWRQSDGTLLRYFNQDPNNGGTYITSFVYSPDGSVFAFARVDNHVVMARNPFATCAGALAPTQQAFPSRGGTGSATLNMTDACAWNAVSNVPWVTLPSGSAGNGSGTIHFTVGRNFALRPRTGTLTVGDQVLTITEAGRSETDR